MEFSHVSVLLRETIEELCIRPEGVYVDGTLGRAGHSREIARRLTAGRLICIDQDMAAITAAEERLAASGRLCQVEILKTAHHGSRHSSAKRFLDQVQPAVSLISCSAGNRYGHPGEETLQRLSEAGSRVFITKDCGALRIWTDGEKVRVAKWICR